MSLKLKATKSLNILSDGSLLFFKKSSVKSRQKLKMIKIPTKDVPFQKHKKIL